MLEVMMALGTYRFGLSTAAYHSLQRSASWRWPEQERIGAAPVLQYTGPGSQTIRLAGTIHPHYKGLLGLPNLLARVPLLAAGLGYVASANSALGRVGLGIGGRPGTWQLEGMRTDAGAGVPLLLVDGRGRIWGYWVILDLAEDESSHMADGASLAVGFTATLSYYGDTAPAALSADTSIAGALRGLLGI